MVETAAAPTRAVSVIGTGAIGSAVVRALLRAGRRVVVWNRTPGRSAELVAAGAEEAESLAAAVAAAPLALVTVSDYAAVRAVLDGLGSAPGDRTIVALSTGGPADAERAAASASALGFGYLHGGIQATPDTIGTDTARFLYSGSRASYDQHGGTLGLLGEARFVGETPGAAALWDLALFGIWYDAQLGLLRALVAARDAGIDLTEFAGTAATQLGHVVAGARETAEELASGHHPAGPATLAEHLPVLNDLLALRKGTPLGDGGLAVVRDLVRRLVEDGRGREGLSAVGGTLSG